jgi:PBP1b-binding outer membrane lipoprotein LpoB
MRRKIIFIILISLLILTSGCTNANVKPQEQQKTTKIDTSTLDSSKVILNELEMK